METHTRTCTRQLVWKYCEKRKVYSLALKDDRVNQCLRSCGSEFQMWGPKQEKHESHDPCICKIVLLNFQHAGVRRRV